MNQNRLEGGKRLKGLAKENEPLRPLISIITSTYNADRFLHRTIQSIRAQSYANFEWIVVDGGSTDETVFILNQNEEIVDYWISEKDKGIYDAWNKAINLANGEWVCFVGADDYFASGNILAEMAAVAVQDADIDLICGKAALVDPNGNTIRIWGGAWDWGGHKRYQKIAHPGMMHRKKLFEKFGAFNTAYRIAGDYDFLLRLGPGIKASFINRALVCNGNEGVSRAKLNDVLSETRLIQMRHPNIGAILAARNYVIAWAKIFVKKMLLVH